MVKWRKNETGNDSSNDNFKRTKRVWHLTGSIETTKNGFLSIPNDQWATLTEDDKAFVQKYNAKVKHQEPLSSVSIPPGVTIKNKARRTKTEMEEDNDNVESDEEKPTKKSKKAEKKIKFTVQPNENESE